MQIQPYIIFNGNCEEALNFYAKAFGGEVGSMMRFSDAPPDVQGMSNDNNLVMHATFQAKGLMFMASDSGQTAPSAQGGGAGMVHLSINFDNAGELDNVFAKLSEGGNVTMPLQDTFWGARFGMLTDRFGVNWMFNHDKGNQ